MGIEALYGETEAKMKKSLENLRRELSRIRTGRASPSLLDGIHVDYYGSQTPVNQVANISTPDARTVAIQPWEKSMVPVIEKAIRASNLDINPVSDGNIIRLPIPALSTERRAELAKSCKHTGEDQKVAVRNIRRDANEVLKKAEKDKLITQDDHKKREAEIQKLTDRYIKLVDDQLALKEREVLEQ